MKIDSDLERTYSREIRDDMVRLRQRMRQDPEGDPVIWPMPGQLACAQRPLRDDRRFQIDPDKDGGDLRPDAGAAIIGWVEKIIGHGIRSVICLQHPKELRKYAAIRELECGLLGLYEQWGLEVTHVPWPDPARPVRRRNGWIFPSLQTRRPDQPMTQKAVWYICRDAAHSFNYYQDTGGLTNGNAPNIGTTNTTPE